MSKHSFLKNGLFTAALAFSTAASLEVQGAEISLKNKSVEHGLSMLKDVKTGQAFAQKEGQYILAYFGTAHRMYPGCSGDLGNAGLVQLDAKDNHNIDVLPVLVYPPIETGKGDGLLQSYVLNSSTVHITGLTSNDFRTLTAVSKDHSAPYLFKNEATNFHSQALVLIAPDGLLIKKYTQNDIDAFSITADIKEHAQSKSSRGFFRSFD